MLAGPSVVNCFNSEDGMGVCLRGKMTDAGILPAPALASVDPTAPAIETADVNAEPAPALGEPALDVTPVPATEPGATASDTLIAATFGLLRAEPDGSVVIAGSGTPGTEVEIFANDALLGKATVENSGDWVFVPEVPLPPGGAEITLGETGKEGRAEQSFVVAINEDKSSEPLVVASTPGEASSVLQGIDAPAAVEPATDVAAVDPAMTEPTPAPSVAADEPAAVAAPAAEPTATAAPSTPAAQEASDNVQPATAQPAVEPAAPSDVAPGSQAAEPATEPAPAEPAPAPANEPAAEPAAEPATATEPVPATEPVLATEPAPTAEPETAVAAIEPASATSEVVLEGAPPTIDAIEMEGDETFFAGAGPEGATMRLYVDDKFVADAKVEDGRWLVEGGDVLKQPSQRVRIDMLQPGTAKVASRAEVNFVVELPEKEQPTVLAEADVPVVTQDPETAAEPAAPATAPSPPATPEPAMPAPAEATSAQQAPVTAPVSPVQTPVPVEQPLNPTPATVPEPTPSVPAAEPTASVPADEPDAPVTRAAPLAETQVEPPAVPQPEAESPAPEVPVVETPAPQAPVVSAPEPTPKAPVVSKAEPAPEAPVPSVTEAPAPAVETPEAKPAPESIAQPDIPTMVAVSVGDPNALRFASGKAIIRRGDNLWTIARRVYGEGIKYTTIYQANTGQIRDPDRIYPGQVFELPEGAEN